MSTKCFLWLAELFFLILCTIPILSDAQNEYGKGAIITLKGDTIQGYINDRLASDPEFVIKFKRPLDEQDQLYNPNNLKGYIFDDGRKFESHAVYTVTLRFRSDDQLYADTSGSSPKFLSVLLKSPWLSLYSFHPLHSEYNKGPLYYIGENVIGDEKMTPLLCWGIWNPDLTKDWLHIYGFTGPNTNWESLYFEGYKRTLRKYFDPKRMGLESLDMLYNSSYTAGDLRKLLEYLNSNRQ